MMTPRFACVPALASALFLPGCMSQFSETHYFKSEKDPANYYRLRVHGTTLLASSRYISGYFDEAAVNDYFNEMSQPTKGHFIGPAPQEEPKKDGDGGGGGAAGDGGAAGGDGAPAAAARTASASNGSDDSGIKPIGAKGDNDNRILVMLLSSNSDEIAEQIGAFAQNREIAATLGRVLNRDRVADQVSAARNLKREQDSGKLIAGMGDKMLEALKAAEAAQGADQAKAQEEANRQVLQFVNAAAAEMGSRERFTDLAKAADWLQANRGRLLAD